ncbi:MAG: hypothetical protein DMG09_01070 [Acidobacteria bacterium]|nr:MAG: hypothetical protein DMG09_01070 [Acidobacteriota bacterium]
MVRGCALARRITETSGLITSNSLLPAKSGIRAQARERLRRSGIEPQKYVLVHPTATLFTKQWQEGNFAQLADELSRRFNLPVIFTSARNEERTLLQIASTARRKHLYWSDLALAELFAVIEDCGLFVGNDSGPTHAAAALKKPVVVVWGSSNFVAWHPWRTNYELVRSDLPCMPCPGYTCHAFGKPKCILDIPVDRVLLACERILTSTCRGIAPSMNETTDEHRAAQPQPKTWRSFVSSRLRGKGRTQSTTKTRRHEERFETSLCEGADAGGELLGRYRSCAQLAYHDAGSNIGKNRGFQDGESCHETQGESGNDRIPGSCDVEDFPGHGGNVRNAGVSFKQGHSLFASRHEQMGNACLPENSPTRTHQVASI